MCFSQKKSLDWVFLTKYLFHGVQLLLLTIYKFTKLDCMLCNQIIVITAAKFVQGSLKHAVATVELYRDSRYLSMSMNIGLTKMWS